jgi:hypothetical protein
MSQASEIKSPQSSQPELKPQLKAVLGYLDVQLEPELTRYRRHQRRTKQTTPDPNGQTNQQFQAATDAVAVVINQTAASGGKLFEPQTQGDSWETVVPSKPAPLAISSQPKSTTDPKTNRAEPAVSFSLKSPAPAATPSQGYLESTEALIKSIEERRSNPEEKRSLIASLLTPLGIASMFLFLLSCTALSYVISSPSGRTSLGLNRFFPTPTANPNVATPPTIAATDTSLPPTDSLSPNLAAKEFVNLDLDTLSHIDPNPNPVPLPSVPAPLPPSPATTLPAPANNLTSPNDQGLNNLTQELIPKKTVTPIIPNPVITPPVTGQGTNTSTVQPGGGAAPKVATAIAPTPVRPTAPIKSGDGYYYVVLDYSGQRSFEQAKEVVADAYIAEFKTGKKIQLGALTDAASAKRLRDELQVQGIAAYYDIPKQ